MNSPVIFYLELLGGGVLLATAWLALRALLHGKKSRLDSSSNEQKSILSPGTAWLQFGYRSVINVVLFAIGIYAHSPVIIALAILSFVLPIIILNKTPRVTKASNG